MDIYVHTYYDIIPAECEAAECEAAECEAAEPNGQLPRSCPSGPSGRLALGMSVIGYTAGFG